jgi:hypothetical protein
VVDVTQRLDGTLFINSYIGGGGGTGGQADVSYIVAEIPEPAAIMCLTAAVGLLTSRRRNRIA